MTTELCTPDDEELITSFDVTPEIESGEEAWERYLTYSLSDDWRVRFSYNIIGGSVRCIITYRDSIILESFREGAVRIGTTRGLRNSITVDFQTRDTRGHWAVGIGIPPSFHEEILLS
ncbi:MULTISPECIES: hypothetical protein [unclassified Frankia]|uniref:hypothetical protein n=1 Tax=unclassified Frankia TaxID=2632575 RepID=UPI002AD3A1E3|nr:MULTISPECIES: hypothetical protein [unclassified Frankia]